MYDRILVPVDGSPFSEEVIPYALGIAGSAGARLVLPCIAENDSRKAEAQKYVRTLALKFRAEDRTIVGSRDVSCDIVKEAQAIAREHGIRVGWEVLYGDPVDSITHYLGGRRDALAVMATRARTALQAAVLGSVTSGMVHKSGIPIIVHAAGKAAQAALPKPPVFRRWAAPVG